MQVQRHVGRRPGQFSGQRPFQATHTQGRGCRYRVANGRVQAAKQLTNERPREPHFVSSKVVPFLAAGMVALTSVSTNVPSSLAIGLAEPSGLASDAPVYDAARLLSADKRDGLTQQLQDFEQQTGWRLRAFTTYGTDGRPSDDALRAAWSPDKRTVVINFDASNPNLINVLFIGDEVLAKLRRPWWFELQSRFGNMFFIRDEGEQVAVLSTMAALTTCLGAPDGCTVVPGLPSEQYGFTLALSVAGGLVAGLVTRLEPTGWVKSRWAWLIVFSPVWGSLFINFGLGPVLTRTDDLTPVIANVAGFLAGAVIPYVLTAVLGTPPPPSSTDEAS